MAKMPMPQNSGLKGIFICVILGIVIPIIATMLSPNQAQHAASPDMLTWFQTATTLCSSSLTLIAVFMVFNLHSTKQKIDEYHTEIETISRKIHMYDEIKQAELYMLQDRFDYSTAIKHYTKALSLHENYNAFIRRAEAYLYRGQRGDLDNATEDFQSALRLKPNDSEALFGLGKTLVNQVETESPPTPPTQLSREHYELFKNGSFDGIIVSKTRYHLTHDQIKLLKTAKSKINHALRTNKAADYYFELAKIHSAIDLDEDAFTYYKKCYDAFPAFNERSFFYCRSWLYINKDNTLSQQDYTSILDTLKEVASAPHINTAKANVLLLYMLYCTTSIDSDTLESIRSACSYDAFNAMFEVAS